MKNIIDIKSLKIKIDDIEFIKSSEMNACAYCLFYNPQVKVRTICKRLLLDYNVSVHLDNNLGKCIVNGKRFGYYKKRIKSYIVDSQLVLDMN